VKTNAPLPDEPAVAPKKKNALVAAEGGVLQKGASRCFFRKKSFR